MKINLLSRILFLKTLNYIVSLLFSCLAFTSCLETTSEIPIELSLSVKSFNLPPEAVEESFSIYSNTNSWTVSSSSNNWLTVSPASGQKEGNVTISASVNTVTTPRYAVLTVRGTGVPDQEIQVMQEAAEPTLSLSKTDLTFAASGGQNTFNITSTGNWTVSSNSPTWLTVSPTSSSGNKTVTVTAFANTIQSPRAAVITVTAGNQSQRVNVTQLGSTAPTKAQIRFQKAKAYPECTQMAIVAVNETDILSNYYFGTPSGTSPYEEIPSGSHIPAFSDGVNWYYCFNTTVKTYNFLAGRRYTLICNDNGSSFVFTVRDDGTF